MPENKLHIRSESVQDILTRVPHWMILWGNTLILVFICGFLLLSWFIKYPDLINAQAVVTTSIPPQKEIAKIGGVIDSILVKDKQEVIPSKPLAIIKNSGNFTDITFLKTLLEEIHMERDSFSFPVEEIPYLSLGDISTTYAKFESDYINYILHKDVASYKTRVIGTQLSNAQIQKRINTLENQKGLDEKALTLAKSKLNRNKELYEKGVISLQEYEEREVSYLKEEQRFRNLDITISQLKQSQGDVYIAAKENKLNRDMESIRLYRNAIQSLLTLKESIATWEDTYLLRANIQGTVSYINISNKNQNVNKGDLLFTVIPNDKGNFVSKLMVPTNNSGKVKMGQTVHIKLQDFPEAEFGVLKGNVQSMSAISNAEGFYRVTVTMPQELITSFGYDIQFKAEMQGTAEIITEDLRLIERFFYQLKNLFN